MMICRNWLLYAIDEEDVMDSGEIKIYPFSRIQSEFKLVNHMK